MIVCHDGDSILREIDAAPEDTERRLFYADWLEERGDERCQFVRLEIEVERMAAEDKPRVLAASIARLRRAGAGVDATWRRRLMRSRTSEILIALDSLNDSRSRDQAN